MEHHMHALVRHDKRTKLGTPIISPDGQEIAIPLFTQSSQLLDVGTMDSLGFLDDCDLEKEICACDLLDCACMRYCHPYHLRTRHSER